MSTACGFGIHSNPVPPIELLAVDVDFTLVDEERRIPEENVLALRRASEAGMQVVLASGRIASSLKLFSEELGLPTPLVACNGALVQNEAGAVLADHRLSGQVVETVVWECKRRGVHLNVYADDRVHFAEESALAEMYLRRTRRSVPVILPWEELARLSPNKLIAVGNPADLEPLRLWSEEALPQGAAVVTYSEPEYLEFLCPDCDKGTGLAAIARELGIPRERTAAIGDYLNDVPMLQWAGHSAAVANAVPEAKAVADVIVASHEQCGVAEYVAMLLKNVGK
jgi:Cof subfamily protein (haloacid dehalogenase superfamily)